MGHKINPNVYRLGINKEWRSRWFVKKGVPQLLEEDILIRKIIQNKISIAGIDRVSIERNGNRCRVLVRVAKPGLVIGRGGKGIEELSKAIQKGLAELAMKRGVDAKAISSVTLNVEEVKRTEISAQITAQQIAWDIEKRMPFRKTMKKYLEGVMQNREAQGVKIKLSGRLNGNEIARKEWLAKGRLPLTTLRANMDYGEAVAFTTYGTVGIKVWIYKGEI